MHVDSVATPYAYPPYIFRFYQNKASMIMKTCWTFYPWLLSTYQDVTNKFELRTSIYFGWYNLISTT